MTDCALTNTGLQVMAVVGTLILFTLGCVGWAVSRRKQ